MEANKPKPMVGVDDVLSPDVWTDILTRLSVKSILRCRSVCKSWCSFVSCPNFISDYSARNLNKNGNHVLLRIKEVYRMSYSSHNESSMESRKHDDIPEAYRIASQIVGSCNGLICLSKACNRYDGRSNPIKFLIWNPTIRKTVELPSLPFRPHTQTLHYLGFGFDSKTNDYKVLCVIGNRSYSDSDIKCEIFDLSKGAWRVICSPVPSSWRSGVRRFPDCYLNGAVHWSNDGALLAFSFSDECFREIKIPDYIKLRPEPYWAEVQTRSVTFGGLIYRITWIEGRGGCSVWAMKEYGVTDSWTNVFNINLKISKCTSLLGPGFFRLWKNGEVLMVHEYYTDDWRTESKRDLISYNPETEKHTTLISDITDRNSDFCLYEESLVLM